MRGSLRCLVALVLVTQTIGVAAARPAGLRLVDVTTQTTAASQSILITATEPASYTTRQPDPLTVLVTLRNVDAGEAVARLTPDPTGPVSAVDILDAVDDEGEAGAEVRIVLNRAVRYEVRSRQQTIQVRFARSAAPTPVGDGVPPAPLDTTARVADALISVDTAVDAKMVGVAIRGDGALTPLRIYEAEHLPPRLILDFPRVDIAATSVAPVQIDPVQQVRVAHDSAEVTRVVLELTRPSVYAIERDPSDPSVLRVMFSRDNAGDPVAQIGRPAASIPWPEIARLDGPSWTMAGGVAIPSPTLSDLPPTLTHAPRIAALTGTVGPLPAEVVSLQQPTMADLPAPSSSRLDVDVPAPDATEAFALATLSATRVTPLRGASTPSGLALRGAGQPQAGQPSPGARQYTGEPISMDFQGTDLRAVLRVFAEVSGLNLVIDPSVEGEVNVALTQVPWDQAFDIILRANQLDYEIDGTVVRIASIEQLQEEAENRALLAQSEAEAGELIVFTRSLSYAKAADLVQLITQTTLSPRGEVFTDPRTNTLIIRDLAERLATLDDLLDTLDRAEPQVEIEARIVQASHNSARALGVQWGVTGRAAQELGNTLPFQFPSRGGVTGRVGAPGGQGPSGIDPRALPQENAATVVDLGVGAATTALGLTMGSVNGSLNLDIALSALESQGELNIISSPRVTTQNNVEAEILQGDQIPYQTVANNTVTVQFKEAALTLLVTPQITASNTVIMQVNLENSFADFGRALGDPPIPSIVTQRARTTIQVADGETTVIGGIFENEQSESNNRTPALHRIPLLGWLFKSTDRKESTDELMIFLTPRIVIPRGGGSDYVGQ